MKTATAPCNLHAVPALPVSEILSFYHAKILFVMTNSLKQQHGRWKAFPLLLLLQLVATLALAQVRISGKVTAPDGSPVPGISVQLRNSATGASSDANGQYSFTASIQPGTYTLEFTGIGFKSVSKTISVSGSAASADAVMEEDVLNMDEIVVIGSSLRQSRKQLGNTVNSVSAKQLINTGSGNIGAALQGKVPGAQITQTSGDPSGGISIRMRGTSTIKGSSEPLYVIDGVIVSNATTNVTNLNVGATAGATSSNVLTKRSRHQPHGGHQPERHRKNRHHPGRIRFGHLWFQGQQRRGAHHHQVREGRAPDDRFQHGHHYEPAP